MTTEIRNNDNRIAAAYSIVAHEHFRYIDTETHKQMSADNEIIYRIGEVTPITVTSLYPVSERRFDLIPWAYKRATAAQIESGNYRTVRKGETTWTLATDKDGNTRPLTLTGAQMVALIAGALNATAADILRGVDMVGMHVTYTPQTDWSAKVTSVRKGASGNNRKNRHSRKDATATTAKGARATRRATKAAK